MKKNIQHFIVLIFISFFTSVSAQTLINGSFELGGNGVGFLINGIGYTQINPTTGSSVSGNYAITTNPQLLNSNFISGGDHTTGSGKMLVVDGNTVPNSRLWSSTSTGGALTGFTAGNTYTFSYWIKSVSNDVTNTFTQANSAIFFVNAANINPTITNANAPLPNLGWRQVSYSFTATANNILIELRNNNVGVLGNDFALDDFSITSGALPLTLSYTSLNPTCPSTLNGSIIASAAGGSLPYANYSLSNSSATISNSTGVFNGLAADTYLLSVLDASGATTSPIVINLITSNDITISAPITICEGTPTTLSVSGSSSSYIWTASPADATLSATNNTSANPVVSPTVNTTYTVTSGTTVSTTNLVINGDFTMGDYGFVTDYVNYSIGTVPSSGVQGAYGVVSNPKSWFNPFSACTDHTSSSGNMLVADGSTTGTAKVWYSPAPITIIPGKNYTFSYFLAAVTSGNPAKLEVLINNVSIGLAASAPSTTCVWEEHSYVWNSGTNTTATISIIDREAFGNNDFAIDDLSFKETTTCIYQKSVTITVSQSPSPTIGTITQPTCLASGTVVVSAPLGNNYEYSTGGVFQSSFTFPNLAPNTYLVRVKDVANGCISLPTSVVVDPIPTVVTPIIALIVHPTCVINGFINIASPAGTNIEYSNGGVYQSSSTFSNLISNTYLITAKDNLNGCISAPLSVVINPIPNTATPAFLTIPPVCFGIVIRLPLLSTNGILGSWAPQFDATSTRTYTFTPNPGQCSNTTTLEVMVTTPATSISAIESTAFSNNATIIVTTIGGNGTFQYALDDFSLQFSNVFTNVNSGNHRITVTDLNGCTNLSTTISIIGYPTYFTPNGDGINDFWDIKGLENQNATKIYIFDRYGKLVKQITSNTLGWDGTYNNISLPASDYWFTVEYIEPLTSDLKIFKSHFSLKR